MDHKIFNETKKKIEQYVTEHRLRDAFALAYTLCAGVSKPQLASELQTHEESYKLMLKYAAQGADDPQRELLLTSIGEKILTAADRLERENFLIDKSSLYYDIARFNARQAGETIERLLDNYQRSISAHSQFNTSHYHSETQRSVALTREGLERTIFNRIWTTFPLSAADADAVLSQIKSDILPTHYKQLLLSAIMLGALEFFDDRRLWILLSAYQTQDSAVASLAIIGFVLILSRWPNRNLSQKSLNILNAMRERPDWENDIKTITLELVKTIDTARITRKIQDEIVPEMLKLRPDINKKLNENFGAIDPMDLEENPEWQEMLEKSGITDKLKEMSEIQEDGGDIMMGTFSHLKSFPFFHEPANWFLPFHSDYSDFMGEDAQIMQPLADIIAAATFLCDSDKYSFMLSMHQMPVSQRDMLMSQLKAHEEQLAEVQSASLNTDTTGRKTNITRQVQNLYRFFNLYRRKGEFANPFADGINPMASDELRKDFKGNNIPEILAEFYFNHGYYQQAFNAFRYVEADNKPSVGVLQKMAFSLQKIGRLDHATKYYAQAEILDGQSDWTLRNYARCLMSLGRWEEALSRLCILEDKYPENVNIALQVGRCLVSLGRYDDAIGRYYKVEFLDEQSHKALRPLAWCLFMTKDYEKSTKYFEKLLTTSDAVPTDYLNLGHLALAQGHFKEALNLYSINITSRAAYGKKESAPITEADRSEAMEAFVADMKADAPSLRKIGVNTSLLPLLIDSLRYQS